LSQELLARVKDINNVGAITIQFNRDVRVPTYFNSFNQSILQLMLISYKNESAKRVLLAD